MGAIKIFKDNFDDINILYLEDIFRVTEICNISPIGENLNFDRKFHKYLLGEEVIKDTFILSKTDYLIKSHSSVSDCAILLTETIKQIF